MSVAPTPMVTEEPLVRPIGPEDFLYALWGIKPGESTKLRLAPAPYQHAPEVREWLWRMWGIGGPA
ncbi:MAG: hypothetical protein LC792_00270 [Actinobacteria bacterium]|nr:hypothetical protein [Actinomycetota bacterium]